MYFNGILEITYMKRVGTLFIITVTLQNLNKIGPSLVWEEMVKRQRWCLKTCKILIDHFSLLKKPSLSPKTKPTFEV